MGSLELWTQKKASGNSLENSTCFINLKETSMSKNRLHMGRKYISCLLCSVHPVTASVAGALKGNYGRRETEVELLVLLFP